MLKWTTQINFKVFLKFSPRKIDLSNSSLLSLNRFVEDQLKQEGGKKKKALPNDITCMKLHKDYKVMLRQISITKFTVVSLWKH